MANLPESSTFDAGVYQIETTDPVIGGPSGVTNTPLKNLANRTKYLKDHVGAIEANFAPKASPALTGTPTAPTAAAGTNTTQLATTAFVQQEVGGKAGTASPQMNGTASVGTAAKFSREDHVHPTDSTRAPLASPAFTGAPTAPTPAASANNTQLATTEFVKTAVAGVDLSGFAPKASPAFTGAPTAPTPTQGNNSGQLATTAFVNAEIAADAAPISHVGSTGAAHGVATNLTAGFMSGGDKSKLDGIATGAAAVGSSAPLMDGTAAAGTAATAARSDHVHPTDTTRAPLASPAFTGTPTAPTPANGTNTQQIATTAFVLATRLDQLAAPTADVSMNSRKITGLAEPVGAQDAATKNYVDNETLRADLEFAIHFF